MGQKVGASLSVSSSKSNGHLTNQQGVGALVTLYACAGGGYSDAVDRL